MAQIAAQAGIPAHSRPAGWFAGIGAMQPVGSRLGVAQGPMRPGSSKLMLPQTVTIVRASAMCRRTYDPDQDLCRYSSSPNLARRYKTGEYGLNRSNGTAGTR